MELKHTHRTSFIRSDHELAALSAITTLNKGIPSTAQDINEFEHKFRGHSDFERSLRALATWLRDFNPDFKAVEHDCAGQLCDQDGEFDTAIVERKPEAKGLSEQES